jgi:hypothetical protein
MFGKLLFKVQVSGESCFPELISGKTYSASSMRRPKVGRYVAFKPQEKSANCVVKKITRIAPDALCVGGTVSWSSTYIIPCSAVVGTLFFAPMKS